MCAHCMMRLLVAIYLCCSDPDIRAFINASALQFCHERLAVIHAGSARGISEQEESITQLQWLRRFLPSPLASHLPTDLLRSWTRLSRLQLAAHQPETTLSARAVHSLAPTQLQGRREFAHRVRQQLVIHDEPTWPQRLRLDHRTPWAPCHWNGYRRHQAAYYQQIKLALQSKGDEQQAQVAFAFAKEMADMPLQAADPSSATQPEPLPMNVNVEANKPS